MDYHALLGRLRLDSFEILISKLYDPLVALCMSRVVAAIVDRSPGFVSAEDRTRHWFNPKGDKIFIQDVPAFVYRTKDISNYNNLRSVTPNFAYFFGSFRCSPSYPVVNEGWCGSPTTEDSPEFRIYENVDFPLAKYALTCEEGELLLLLLQIFHSTSLVGGEATLDDIWVKVLPQPSALQQRSEGLTFYYVVRSVAVIFSRGGGNFTTEAKALLSTLPLERSIDTTTPSAAWKSTRRLLPTRAEFIPPKEVPLLCGSDDNPCIPEESIFVVLLFGGKIPKAQDIFNFYDVGSYLQEVNMEEWLKFVENSDRDAIWADGVAAFDRWKRAIVEGEEGLRQEQGEEEFLARSYMVRDYYRRLMLAGRALEYFGRVHGVSTEEFLSEFEAYTKDYALMASTRNFTKDERFLSLFV